MSNKQHNHFFPYLFLKVLTGGMWYILMKIGKEAGVGGAEECLTEQLEGKLLPYICLYKLLPYICTYKHNQPPWLVYVVNRARGWISTSHMAEFYNLELLGPKLKFYSRWTYTADCTSPAKYHPLQRWTSRTDFRPHMGSRVSPKVVHHKWGI